MDLEVFSVRPLGTGTATRKSLLKTGNVAMKLGKTVAHWKIKQSKRNAKTAGTIPTRSAGWNE